MASTIPGGSKIPLGIRKIVLRPLDGEHPRVEDRVRRRGFGKRFFSVALIVLINTIPGLVSTDPYFTSMMLLGAVGTAVLFGWLLRWGTATKSGTIRFSRTGPLRFVSGPEIRIFSIGSGVCYLAAGCVVFASWFTPGVVPLTNPVIGRGGGILFTVLGLGILFYQLGQLRTPRGLSVSGDGIQWRSRFSLMSIPWDRLAACEVLTISDHQVLDLTDDLDRTYLSTRESPTLILKPSRRSWDTSSSIRRQELR